MFSPSQQRGKGECVAVFDIGSGSVGGALVFLSPDSLPTLYATARAEIAPRESPSFDDLALGALGALASIAEHLGSRGMREARERGIPSATPRGALCVFSSPWHISEGIPLRRSQTSGFIVSPELLEQFVSLGAHQIPEGALSRARSAGATLIEQTILDVRLNGYSTSFPFGKRARELEVSVFLSAVESSVFARAQRILEREFPNSVFSYHSRSLLSFTVLRDLYGALDDFVILDIGGEVTDAVVLRGGNRLEHSSFPLGTHTLVRAAAEHAGSVFEEVRTLLRASAMRGGVITSEAAGASLERAKRQWASSLAGALRGFTENGPLPAHFFFSAAPELAPQFSAMLAEQVLPQLSFIGTSRVHSVAEGETFSRCRFAGGVRRDPFLALPAIFASRTPEAG